MPVLLDNVRAVLDPGEEVQSAFRGQTGINPLFALAIGKFLIVMTNKQRIVAITDRRIAVFATAGQVYGGRMKPQGLLFSLPRDTRLEHGDGSRSKIVVGGEKIWVTRRAYSLIDAANANAPTAS
jgi:hypothetical protein